MHDKDTLLQHLKDKGKECEKVEEEAPIHLETL